MATRNITLASLQQQFTGDIILPDNPLYGEARRTYMGVSYGAEESRPAAILRPHTAEETAAAVRYAQARGLVISVRSGGHSGASHSTNDGGIVIDLANMQQVDIVDEAKHVVRIGGGARWGAIAKSLRAHGLALTSGDTASVGVGGLTLGGGIGWMVRKHGLAIDSLVGAEVVTASGDIVRADAVTNPELFWALRGGGGNFGVVTAFEFAAHEVKKVLAGSIVYRPDDLGGLLKGWRDYMRTAPDELTTTFLLMPSFDDSPPGAIIMVCWCGEKTAGEQAVARLRLLGTVVNAEVSEKEYDDVLEDAHPPQGMKVVVRNAFVQDCSDELIDVIGEAFKDGGLVVQIRSLGGAFGRVAPDATALAHRSSEMLFVVPAFLDPHAAPGEADAALALWRKIEKFGSGAYVNFLTSATDDDVKAAYPPVTYKRLAEVKRTYDPGNIFNRNYNIRPAAE